jgi:hypothetical protein
VGRPILRVREQRRAVRGGRGKYMATEKFFAAPEKSFGFCDVVFG